VCGAVGAVVVVLDAAGEVFVVAAEGVVSFVLGAAGAVVAPGAPGVVLFVLAVAGAEVAPGAPGVALAVLGAPVDVVALGDPVDVVALGAAAPGATTGLGLADRGCERRGAAALSCACVVGSCRAVAPWDIATTIPTATPTAARAAIAALRRGRFGRLPDLTGGATVNRPAGAALSRSTGAAVNRRAGPGSEHAASSAPTNRLAVDQRSSGRFAMPRASTASTAFGSARLRALACGGSSAMC
jgi:hypothetical protein